MIRRALLIPCTALLIAGCATVPDARGRADVEVRDDFVADYRPPPGDDELWWRGFGDPALDALVEQALADNLDVAAARSRLEAAAAFLRAERADRLPTIDGGASIDQPVTGGSSSDPTAGASINILFDPGLDGRLSAEMQAASARAAGARYLVADQRRLVAAAVAQQYIELRRTGERLRLLDESTELQEQTLRIVTLRFEAGLSANLDVRRAAADLAQTRAQRGLLELARAQAANALSILTGEQPGQIAPYDTDQGGIPSFAGGPPVGVPADLLRRRPDLLVAEADLLEAAANIGIERSDLLPSLVIPGQLLIGDGSVGGLFSDFFASVGAALDLPLFDGGRRRAEVAAAQAEADARFAEYRRDLLSVLADAENALVGIRSYTERNAELARAIEESERAFGQSDALYREGLASLFDVLDAQRQLIASRESLIDSEASLASSVVALYAAVGAPTDAAVARADETAAPTERPGAAAQRRGG